MKFTLKENLNTKSLVLKHNIIMEATMLLQGREGALITEKEIYTMMAMVNIMVNEDLFKICNEDKRDLSTIIVEDIEPFFTEMLKDEKYNNLFMECKKEVVARCKEIWDNQHSIIGVLDTVLVALESLTDDDKKEVLKATGEIAKQAFDDRTKKMEKATERTNDKLQELIAKYQKPLQREIDKIEKTNEE